MLESLQVHMLTALAAPQLLAQPADGTGQVTDPAIDKDVPNPDVEAPPGLGEAVNTALSWLKWGAFVAGVAGLLWCAIMMGIGRRNRSAMAVEGAMGVPWGLLAVSLAVAAPALVSAFV
ncbi:hypothetical protein MXD62_28620 [Frankia sp. Mgl5]|uniref:hypothetical protein n=1 Tax=Frankia sp. Mgl5 TaxID=2933793 RepID=UPI00200D2A70|nr:hypothetical protein [Frankia sp. Mgl5]MCK9931061.1 hypothetical protein [Frankia sp. Mgl5]